VQRERTTWIQTGKHGEELEMTDRWTRREARNDATAALEARVNHTTLASLVLWANKNGYVPRTKSELIRIGLELLVEQLITTDENLRIESTEEAMEILESFGFAGLNRQGRGKRALQSALGKESLADRDWSMRSGTMEISEQARRMGALPVEEIMRRAAENQRRVRDGLEPLYGVRREDILPGEEIMPTGETKSEAIARLKQEALVKAGIVKQESPEKHEATSAAEAQTRRAFLEAQIARQQAELARLAQEAEGECQTAMFSD
jgi:hypothetical protein